MRLGKVSWKEAGGAILRAHKGSRIIEKLIIYRALGIPLRKVLPQYWDKINPILKAVLSHYKSIKASFERIKIFLSNITTFQNKA